MAAEHKDTIILYEDDDDLAAEILLAGAEAGFAIERLTAEADVFHRARQSQASVLIMDRMVGDRDSLAIVTALRREASRVPVLVISSMASVDERINGLKAGGDDYLVKPFAMGELIARVEALRRRAAQPESLTRLTVGPLVLDLIERMVRRDDRLISLLPREFGLLEYLMRHAGQTVTRAMLLEDVWHYRVATQTNVVDVHVGNLRRKIDADGEPRLIESVRGLGFRLVEPTA